MRREIVECDICGKETTKWYEFKTKYYEIAPICYHCHETKFVCWHCMEATKNLIKKERGV